MLIVTEAIYDVRESDTCPRTFETHFILLAIREGRNWVFQTYMAIVVVVCHILLVQVKLGQRWHVK